MAIDPEDVQTSDVGPASCPSCGEVLDVASGIGRPRPGDLSLCAYCFVFLVFEPHGTQLQHRVLSNAEWLKFPMPYRRHLSHMREEFRAHTELYLTKTKTEGDE